MIREICRLHSKLQDNEKIVVMMARYDYETSITKEDDLKIVGGNTLRITRKSNRTTVINANYIVTAFIKSKEWY